MSLSSCFIRCSCCIFRSSKPGSRRQFSIDKNDRHRGSDEGDAPLLWDGDVAPGEGEVVIGGEKGDQAEGKATDGLGETQLVESESAKSESAKTETVRARPGRRCCQSFWRRRRLLAAGWWIGGAGRWGHGAGAETGGVGSKGSVPPAGSGCRRLLLPQGIQAPSTGPPGRVATWCSLERPPLINASSVRRKGSWLPSAPARTLSMSRSARAMAGTRQGWREPAEMRRGRWLQRKGKSNGLNSGHGWLPWPCGV
jgi:hypothetical protein